VTQSTYAASALFWIILLAVLGWGSGIAISAAVNHWTRRGGRK
jgi:hypothetical protein